MLLFLSYAVGHDITIEAAYDIAIEAGFDRPRAAGVKDFGDTVGRSHGIRGGLEFRRSFDVLDATGEQSDDSAVDRIHAGADFFERRALVGRCEVEFSHRAFHSSKISPARKPRAASHSRFFKYRG